MGHVSTACAVLCLCHTTIYFNNWPGTVVDPEVIEVPETEHIVFVRGNLKGLTHEKVGR
jgi:hypothetical protein